MKVGGLQDLSNVSSWEDLRRFSTQDINLIVSVLNGNVGFTDNCKTSLITVDFDKANHTIATKHGLGSVPQGYLLAGLTTAIEVFDGTSSNTSDTIYLQASGAGTARLLVF